MRPTTAFDQQGNFNTVWRWTANELWKSNMYISRLQISNFRCFRDAVVDFQPGLNVILGENNAGKTALLQCLAMVFQRDGRRRSIIHDFSKTIPPTTSPPAISVTATLRSSEADTLDDKGLVATWLTKLEMPWEAQLTYRFFLPEEFHGDFQKRVSDHPTPESFFEAIEALLPKYVGRTYGGNPDNNIAADPDLLSKFDFEFIDAIRDVQSEMFAGSNPLFRAMLREVLDTNVSDEEKQRRRLDFRGKSTDLRSHIVGRLDLGSLFKLVEDTGAGDGGKPTLSGDLQEQDIIAALRLFVAKQGFDLPVTHNGLGYNNLVYIALLLASLEFKRSVVKHGPNAILFPLLVVEEPEAHLHPALQYRLLKYVRNRLDVEGGSRQVFLTTHSTQITAAAGLRPLMCLSLAPGDDIHVAYPDRVFPESAAGHNSRAYVERYLDATKSNMLFAKSILLVEGIAEQILLPVCAEYLGLPFEEKHVAVVRVDGLTFKHFLHLFGPGCPAPNAGFSLQRRVACLVDADPVRRKYGTTEKASKCWPFQMQVEPTVYEYKAQSDTVASLQCQCDGSENVNVFVGTNTFEYDLAAENRSSFMVTDECTHAKKLRRLTDSPPVLESELEAYLTNDPANPKVSLDSMPCDETRNRAQFATCYLLCIEDSKGAHAFALEQSLRTRLANNASPRFECPEYVADAIRWVCGNVPAKASP
jgi:putative ATP-dependent endonuclease of OLD family